MLIESNDDADFLFRYYEMALLDYIQDVINHTYTGEYRVDFGGEHANYGFVLKKGEQIVDHHLFQYVIFQEPNYIRFDIYGWGYFFFSQWFKDGIWTEPRIDPQIGYSIQSIIFKAIEGVKERELADKQLEEEWKEIQNA